MADFAYESGFRPGTQASASTDPHGDRRFAILGIPVSATSLEEANGRIESWADDDQGRMVCIRDVHGVMRAQDDPELFALHQEADMITPDGMPLVILGKLRGEAVSRTCGPDLMEQVCARSPSSGLKHYFYGGKEGVAADLKAKFEARYPGIEIVGAECPPFRALTDAEDAALIDRINASGADIVWVGLSTPKQEFWMRDHRPKLSATLIGVGAAYDFHTGAIQRAPKWMQDFALEWLHRFMSEPKRLWRRYLILAPKFIMLTGYEMMTRSAGSSTGRAGLPR